MNYFPTFNSQPFLKDRTNRWLWLIATSLTLGVITLAYFSFSPRTETINLQYNIYFGVSKIGNWWEIFYYPAYGVIVTLINCALAWVFYKKEKAVAYVLAGLSILGQLIIAWQIFMVIMLNTN